MYYSIKRTKNGQFTVTTYAKNGEPLCHSENLSTFAAAKKNIASMIRGHKSPQHEVFLVYMPEENRVMYAVVKANGRLVFDASRELSKREAKRFGL